MRRVAVVCVGELVDVRADLAEMAEEPRQLLAFDRRAADGAGAGIAEGQGAHKSADAQTGLVGSGLDRDPFLLGAPYRGNELGSRVLDPLPAPPRSHVFSTRFCSPARHRTPP